MPSVSSRTGPLGAPAPCTRALPRHGSLLTFLLAQSPMSSLLSVRLLLPLCTWSLMGILRIILLSLFKFKQGCQDMTQFLSPPLTLLRPLCLLCPFLSLFPFPGSWPQIPSQASLNPRCAPTPERPGFKSHLSLFPTIGLGDYFTFLDFLIINTVYLIRWLRECHERTHKSAWRCSSRQAVLTHRCGGGGRGPVVIIVTMALERGKAGKGGPGRWNSLRKAPLYNVTWPMWPIWGKGPPRPL